MDATKLRAWWWRRQGLDGSLEGRPASEILARTGWARSVGGAGPYLALFARGRIRRPAVDAALERMEIQELPAARGCTYVVPAQDCALALVAGQGFDTEMATARKLGVTDREIEQLCSAVLKALLKGSLEPEELKQAAGGAARSLGPEGVKKGLAGTMPLALGRLQAEGEIRRIPANGRLDQQRYRYALWRPGPFHRARPSPAEALVELARRFFSWTGPARLSEFQWFSGFGARVVRASVEPLDLVSVGGDLLLLPEDREEFEGFQAPG